MHRLKQQNAEHVKRLEEMASEKKHLQTQISFLQRLLDELKSRENLGQLKLSNAELHARIEALSLQNRHLLEENTSQKDRLQRITLDLQRHEDAQATAWEAFKRDKSLSTPSTPGSVGRLLPTVPFAPLDAPRTLSTLDDLHHVIALSTRSAAQAVGAARDPTPKALSTLADLHFAGGGFRTATDVAVPTSL
jgi:hypothetical protein